MEFDFALTNEDVSFAGYVRRVMGAVPDDAQGAVLCPKEVRMLCSSRWVAKHQGSTHDTFELRPKGHKLSQAQRERFNQLDGLGEENAVWVENNNIYLYGEVSPWSSDVNFNGVYEAVQVVRQRYGPSAQINVRIHSPGGSVPEGVPIIGLLQRISNPVVAQIDGWALSMGALIAISAPTTNISPMGMMMFHRVETAVWGNADDLREEVKILESADATILRVLEDKTGMPMGELDELLNPPTWMNAEEALAAGFVDAIDYGASVERVPSESAGASEFNNQRMNNQAKSRLLNQRKRLALF